MWPTGIYHALPISFEKDMPTSCALIGSIDVVSVSNEKESVEFKVATNDSNAGKLSTISYST